MNNIQNKSNNELYTELRKNYDETKNNIERARIDITYIINRLKEDKETEQSLKPTKKFICEQFEEIEEKLESIHQYTNIMEEIKNELKQRAARTWKIPIQKG